MSSYTRCDWCNGPIDGNKSTIVLSRQNLHHTCALQLGREISEAVGEYETTRREQVRYPKGTTDD